MLYTYDNKQEYKRAFLQELGIKVSAELFILVEDEEKKMVTGELKNKIDSLWEIFWTGGLTNPLEVIEQMTYLMFIRDLDDADNTHAK